MRTRPWLPIAALWLLLGPSCPAGADTALQAQDGEQGEATVAAEYTPSYGRGLVLFQRYCRSCHGKEARGDGSVAKYLKVAPTDLTRLTADNDGEFPTERVLESIDGREVSVPLHGRDMPIWGAVFQVEDDQTEADVRAKLADLVAYLQGLQAAPASEADDQP